LTDDSHDALGAALASQLIALAAVGFVLALAAGLL
jgi:hypothetical protein